MARPILKTQSTSWLGWLGRWFGPAPARRGARARPALEPLEDRVLPAATPMYLMMPGISGGVTAPGFKQGIFIDEFHWDVANPVSASSSASPLNASLPQLGDLTFVTGDFPGAGQLNDDAVSGQTIGEVLFVVLNADKNQLDPIMTWDLEKARVTSFQETSDTHDRPEYQFTLAYAKVAVNALTTSNGSLYLRSAATWNLVDNTGTQSRMPDFGTANAEGQAVLTIDGESHALTSYAVHLSAASPSDGAAAAPTLGTSTFEFSTDGQQVLPSFFAAVSTGERLTNAVVQVAAKYKTVQITTSLGDSIDKVSPPLAVWALKDFRVDSLAVASAGDGLYLSCGLVSNCVTLSYHVLDAQRKPASPTVFWNQLTGSVTQPNTLTYGASVPAPTWGSYLAVAGSFLEVSNYQVTREGARPTGRDQLTVKFGMNQSVPTYCWALMAGQTFDQLVLTTRLVHVPKWTDTWTLSQVAMAEIDVTTTSDGETRVTMTMDAADASLTKTPVITPPTSVPQLPIHNLPPSANAGGPYTITLGNALTLGGSQSADTDGDQLTYAWDINSSGHGVSAYQDASGVNPTLTWEQLNLMGITRPGTYAVRLRVDDGHGNVVYANPTTVAVQLGSAGVQIYMPPPAAGSNYYVGQTLFARAMILTPGPYQYIWTVTPPGAAAITGQGEVLSFVPQESNVYTIDLTVVDGEGNRSSAELSFLVAARPAFATVAGHPFRLALQLEEERYSKDSSISSLSGSSKVQPTRQLPSTSAVE